MDVLEMLVRSGVKSSCCHCRRAGAPCPWLRLRGHLRVVRYLVGLQEALPTRASLDAARADDVDLRHGFAGFQGALAVAGERGTHGSGELPHRLRRGRDIINLCMPAPTMRLLRLHRHWSRGPSDCLLGGGKSKRPRQHSAASIWNTYPAAQLQANQLLWTLDP